MHNGKVCDPYAMVRGSVMQQTSMMMALPLLLLVMSRGLSDHTSRLCLLFALLMSTSGIKLSSFSIVGVIALVFLGLQVLAELKPWLELLYGTSRKRRHVKDIF